MVSTTSLKRNHEFRRLYNKGKSAASKCVVVYARKNTFAGKNNFAHRNGGNGNRLGITVSTKLGGAVVRNRIRRRLKEAYRVNEHRIKTGYDIVFVARNRSRIAAWDELQSSVVKMLDTLGLLRENP